MKTKQIQHFEAQSYNSIEYIYLFAYLYFENYNKIFSYCHLHDGKLSIFEYMASR